MISIIKKQSKLSGEHKNIQLNHNLNYTMSFQFKSLKQDLYVTNDKQHLFYKDGITILFTGDIVNKNKLSNFLKIKGIQFLISEEIEIIYYLILYFKSIYSHILFSNIVDMVMKQLKGSYSIIIHNKNNRNQILIKRCRLLLFVGHNQSKTAYTILTDPDHFGSNIDCFYKIKQDTTTILDFSLDNIIPTNIKIYNHIPYQKKKRINFDICHYINQTQKRLQLIDKQIMVNTKHIIFITDIRSYYSVLHCVTYIKHNLYFNNIQVIKTTSFYKDNIPKTKESLIVFVSLHNEFDYIYDIVHVLKSYKPHTIAFVSKMYLDIVDMVDQVIYIPDYEYYKTRYMHHFVIESSLFLLFGFYLAIKKQWISFNMYLTYQKQVESMFCSLNKIKQHYDIQFSRLMIHKYDKIMLISDSQFEYICKETMNQMNIELNQRVHYYKIDDVQYLDFDDIDDHKTIWFMIEMNTDVKYISCLQHIVFISQHHCMIFNDSKKDTQYYPNNIQHTSSILNHYYLISLFESMYHHFISQKTEG